MRELPVRFLVMMSGGRVSIAQTEGLVEMLNGHYMHGLRMILRKKAA